MTPRIEACSLLALLAVLLASAAPEAQNRPALPDVLKAAADYTVKYAQQISAIVGEEQYTQHDTSSGQLRGSRRLKADFAIVGLDGGQVVSFRDVYELDGTALRERQERLAPLFGTPADSAKLEQAQELSTESVRQYLSPNLRVLDQPLVPLEFIRAENQPRFQFKLDNVRKMDGKDVAIVRYTETGAERFIKSPTNTPVTGRLWIEAQTGAVRETELSFSGKDFNLRAAVKYKNDAQLGLWLPSEMTQTSDIRAAGDGGISNMGAGGGLGVRESLEARAYYSNFRKVSAGSD
jgi:hypothetical protein